MFAWSQESQLSEILGPNSLLNANTDIDQEYLAYTFFQIQNILYTLTKTKFSIFG